MFVKSVEHPSDAGTFSSMIIYRASHTAWAKLEASGPFRNMKYYR